MFSDLCRCAGKLVEQIATIARHRKVRMEIVKRSNAVRGFKVLPKRWIVERTFAWLARYRRHSKDYEKTTASAEAFTYIAMINLMSKRIENTEN